jgi:deoxycytidylate deaminase
MLQMRIAALIVFYQAYPCHLFSGHAAAAGIVETVCEISYLPASLIPLADVKGTANIKAWTNPIWRS